MERYVLRSRSKGKNAKARSRSRERKAISSPSKYSAITGKRCAGAKNTRGGLNPSLVFSVFDQPSHNLKADTKLDFVLKPLLMGAEWQHFKRIAVPRSPLTVKNETLKGRFGNKFRYPPLLTRQGEQAESTATYQY